MGLPEVSVLKGVGAVRQKQLARLGITTVRDLLYHFPRSYEDWSPRPVAALADDGAATVCGVLQSLSVRRARRRRLYVTQAVLVDETGRLPVIWFSANQYLPRKLQSLPGPVLLRGQVQRERGQLLMKNPDWRRASASGKDQASAPPLLPVYPLTEGLDQFRLRGFIREAIKRFAKRLKDPFPEELRREQNCPALATALQMIHFPASREEVEAARSRFAFEELYALAKKFLAARRESQTQRAVPLRPEGELTGSFFSSLPFSPTGAQERAMGEIDGDLQKAVPMRRLLQGDVGAGKTVVAAYCMARAAESGLQAVMMAPTELLAEQHRQKLRDFFAPLGVEVGLLCGSASRQEQEQVKSRLASGELLLAVGTHSLISDDVSFARLAVVVVDEQHRFGVNQRKKLLEKGSTGTAHYLALSATPIPRTLALAFYGDLDTSVLDEVPAGRIPVDTRWISPDDRNRVYQFIQRQAREGRQAYIVYPAVFEGTQSELKSCVEEAERLQNGPLRDLRLGVLHGQMPGEAKDRAMRAFLGGEIDVLVTTTVVEVGVDVPNATVMVIEHADRYGLAQLHQLRGRVGRSHHQSYCLLIASPTTAAARERLNILRETINGFTIAEKDLKLRGPGEFFGIRQAGLLDLKVADLQRDYHLVPKAWEAARRFGDY